ncbi:MAG TPA: hypothetical protein VHB21_06725 [Minicystis sp.]|nr:hypothetical protein [Minicystis sp.]
MTDDGGDLLNVIRRELGAEDVRLVDAADAAVEAPLEIAAPVDERLVVVRFAEAPPDAAVAQARLELLVDGFRDRLADVARPSKPPPPTLDEALAALVERAGACDALVIDAHSPVVWGRAGEDRTRDAAQVIPYSSGWRDRRGADELLRTADRFGVSPTFDVAPDEATAALVPASLCEARRVAPLRVEGRTLELAMADPADVDAVHDAALATGLDIEPVAAFEGSIAAFVASRAALGEAAASVEPAEADDERRAHAARERASWVRHLATRAAVPAVRALPELAALPKGGHLHHAYAEARFGFAAHSFAGIYVLVLVFDGPFDELGARRATQHALPTIERLVLSLPPRDPTTSGHRGAVALRRSRRR